MADTSTYPAALDGDLRPLVPAASAPSGMEDFFQLVADAVSKIETELGTNPSGAAATVAAAIAALAPLASPAFTGTPTAPTAAGGTSSTQLATTAFVAAALAALVDSSPAALDTLNELAAALGDDPNFATTVTTALAAKADATALADHLADTADAHDASAVSYAGGTGMSATDVEAALDELATEKLDSATAAATYAPLATAVLSSDYDAIVEVTQAEYDALTPDASTLYIISDATKTEQPLRVTFDGGGSALTTGAKQVYLSVPFDCTVTRWRLLADQPGSVVIDVWSDTFANFPPVDADSIAGTDLPTLSSAQTAESTALTGWSTALLAGDVIECNVDSAATVTKVILELWVETS